MRWSGSAWLLCQGFGLPTGGSFLSWRAPPGPQTVAGAACCAVGRCFWHRGSWSIWCPEVCFSQLHTSLFHFIALIHFCYDTWCCHFICMYCDFSCFGSFTSLLSVFVFVYLWCATSSFCSIFNFFYWMTEDKLLQISIVTVRDY